MTTVVLPPTPRIIPPGKVRTLDDSFVIGLFGDRGAGKSAVMASFAWEEWKLGRQIIYYPETLGLTIPGAIAMGPLELGAVPELLDGATVCIDEIQELLSKFRTNTMLSQHMMGLFRQVRKRGTNVYFTSNDPDSINKAVADQTDLHGMCSMIVDPRCKQDYGYHFDGCLDTVRIKWKDTQGKHGIRPGRKDGRKRMVQHIVGISGVYPTYDTASIAEFAAVAGVSKADVIGQKQSTLLGRSWVEFDTELITYIIPQLVTVGVMSLTPVSFVKTLKDKYNIPEKGKDPMDPRALGRRLKGIGLTSKRGHSGVIYSLPPAEMLEDWAAGLWSPIDDL